MTNQPPGPKPVRNLRVTDEIWDTALRNATEEGRTLTEVITSYLKRYNAAAAGKRAAESRPVEPATPVQALSPAARMELAITAATRQVPTDPAELPDHQTRLRLFEDHLTIEEYTRFKRAELDANAAGTPKFSLPDPVSPEALSLGMYIRARADRKL